MLLVQFSLLPDSNGFAKERTILYLVVICYFSVPSSDLHFCHFTTKGDKRLYCAVIYHSFHVFTTLFYERFVSLAISPEQVLCTVCIWCAAMRTLLTKVLTHIRSHGCLVPILTVIDRNSFLQLLHLTSTTIVAQL